MMNKNNIDRLKELGFYLEGIKQGKGSLYPLGEVHLEALWNAITELNKQ